MPARNKGRLRQPRVDTPLKDLALRETLAHYNAVLLEDIQGKITAVIERMEFGFDSLRRDMQRMETTLTDRITTVEIVVKSHSADLTEIKATLAEHSTAIGRLSADVTEIKTTLAHHSTDLAEIKATLKPLPGRLESHETRMVRLEERVA